MHTPLSRNIRLYRQYCFSLYSLFLFANFYCRTKLPNARYKTTVSCVQNRLEDARKPGKPMQTGETLQQHDQNNRLLLGPHPVRSQLNSPSIDALNKVGEARSHLSSITRKRPVTLLSYIWQLTLGGRQAAIQSFLKSAPSSERSVHHRRHRYYVALVLVSSIENRVRRCSGLSYTTSYPCIFLI